MRTLALTTSRAQAITCLGAPALLTLKKTLVSLNLLGVCYLTSPYLSLLMSKMGIIVVATAEGVLRIK